MDLRKKKGEEKGLETTFFFLSCSFRWATAVFIILIRLKRRGTHLCIKGRWGLKDINGLMKQIVHKLKVLT